MIVISTTNTYSNYFPKMSLYPNFHQKTIVTPINKNNNSNSNIDYRTQLERVNLGQQLMWDDAKGNPTKELGGSFGFVHNGKCVELYIVVGIMTPSDRHHSWRWNVGHEQRQVLLLSPMFTTIDWVTWLKLGGPKKTQKTSRVVRGHNTISKYLTQKFNQIEYQVETNEIIM
jgi:hypothetical protein